MLLTIHGRRWAGPWRLSRYWVTGRGDQSEQGAKLLMPSDAAAPRLGTCSGVFISRGDASAAPGAAPWFLLKHTEDSNMGHLRFVSVLVLLTVAIRGEWSSLLLCSVQHHFQRWSAQIKPTSTAFSLNGNYGIYLYYVKVHHSTSNASWSCVIMELIVS